MAHVLSRLLAFGLTTSLVFGTAGSVDGAESPYWLQFGKPARTCETSDKPFKVQGASWGVLASGVILCHKTETSYVYDIQFLNVFIDVADKQAITRDELTFDWCGLALFKPSAAGDDVDWLYEHSVPIKGTLRRESTGRIVFGRLSFEVPKDAANAATNMLFYITFQGPMVVIGVV